MNCLAFDTSTPTLTIALRVGQDALVMNETTEEKHSSVLLGKMNELLTQAQLTVRDIDRIAVGIGPGSFMGLRTAVATAQGLAAPWSIPIYPFSSLRLLAETAHDDTGVQRVIAAIDARQGAVYWGEYQWHDERGMQVVGGDRLDAEEVFRQTVERQALPAVGAVADAQALQPEVSAMLKYIVTAASDECVAANALAPNYLRNDVAHKKSDS